MSVRPAISSTARTQAALGQPRREAGHVIVDDRTEGQVVDDEERRGARQGFTPASSAISRHL
jgi:hypothetical protein